MEDGLYRVEFATPIGKGFGVVSKRGDRAEGGDSGYSYVGTFTQTGSDIAATVRVAQHTSGMQSVFGPLTNFDLNLQGTATGNSANLKGSSPSAQGLTLDVTLSKLA